MFTFTKMFSTTLFTAILWSLASSTIPAAVFVSTHPSHQIAIGDYHYVTAMTNSGVVRGFRSTVRGKLVDTYYGIPYAMAPTGRWRFNGWPSHPPTWTGVRDALVPSQECVQATRVDKKGPYVVKGSEDCLYLNIHAPAPTGKKVPVMVWIHGGSYRTGQGAIYDGSILATKAVIVVTFNYRLDAFGFLSTEDNVMPGNYGMMDQIQALQWVQDNIKYFGGDPLAVTIFGESAGASSVSLLVLSPLASGLFRNAIMESGSSLSAWAYAHPERSVSHKQAAKLIGARVGCTASDSKTFYECLLKVDAARLVNASRAVCDSDFDTVVLMNPRVEHVYGFLPDLPMTMITNGRFNKVNTIRGYNEDESGFFYDLKEIETIATPVVLAMFVKKALRLSNITDKGEILANITMYYMKDIPMTRLAYTKSIERFETDIDFVGAVINEVGFFSNFSGGKVQHYLYRFNVRPEASCQPEWVTAVHTDEVRFVFGMLNYTKPSKMAVSETMMTLWTNFAKSGNPNRSGKEEDTSVPLDESSLSGRRDLPDTNGRHPVAARTGKVSSIKLFRSMPQLLDKSIRDEALIKGIGTKWQPFDSIRRHILVFNEDGQVVESFHQPVMTNGYFCLLKKVNNITDPTCGVFG